MSSRRERGLALVLVSLLLVTLMVFAALVVDLGAVYTERRDDQNAADVGALGGAADLISQSTDTEVIEEVRARVHSTLGETLTAAQWNSCGADGFAFPTGYTTLAHATDGVQDCIRADRSSNRLVVRVPQRDVATSFGSVIGVDSIEHSAFAIAGMERVGFGNVLPFGFIAGDSYGCLKDSAAGLSVAPCDGSDAGNFNYLDFTFFGNSAVGTTERCSGQENGRLSNNIAVGIDHDLSRFSGTEVIEGTECGSTEADPNTLHTNTGNRQSAFGSGIYSGSGFSDGSNARLQRTNPALFDGNGATQSVGGHTLDDNPLWEFLPDTFDSGDDVPASCHKSVFDEVLSDDYGSLPETPANVRQFIEDWAAIPANPTDAEKATQMRWLLIRCFNHYEGLSFDGDGSIQGGSEASSCGSDGCGDPVFIRDTVPDDETYDIQLTSRFGYVPQLEEDEFPSGSSTLVHIEVFRAIFLQRLLANCSGNDCDIDFEPMGSGFVPAANESGTSANAITAFIFPPTMLPNGLAGDEAPFALGVNRFVRLIR